MNADEAPPAPHHPSAADLKAIANQLRIHSITSTTCAGSGHPTSSMSAADLVAVLFFGGVMKYKAHDPHAPENDRFILSKGHAAPILYAAWAEAGYLAVDHLKTLRELDSNLEGHPTPILAFVDVATGSLGQGLAVGAGQALAARLDGIDARTFVLMGDGEIMEGSVWEAAAFSAIEELDHLIAIVDVNELGQSAPTAYKHDMELYQRRWESFGWNALVFDGHDIAAIQGAFQEALTTQGKPTVLLARTLKGAGVSFLEGKPGWHGKALKPEEAEKALAELTPNAMSGHGVFIPEPTGPAPKHPDPIPAAGIAYEKGKEIATREAFGHALQRLGKTMPQLTVVDGDTQNSTFTEFFHKDFPDRFFEGYIAEQNMVGVATGLATRGKIPVASTFACFLTRAFDQIRMAGLSGANLKLNGSHAGVSIGEDGGSQMGLEDLAMMRTVFNSWVLYPSEAVSTEKLVQAMLEHCGISYMRTSRPKTPVLYDVSEEFPIPGSKIVRQSENDRITVIGSGVTLFEAIKAADDLAKSGIGVQVIDAYSIKPLDKEGIAVAAARTGNLVITVEDHHMEGGLGDAVAGELSAQGVRVHKLAVGCLPHSGKPEELLHREGIDADSIAQEIERLVC